MEKIDVRMSQLIYTWGVGSIVPLPNGVSAIVAGLDKWENEDPHFQILDDRLAKRLHLKKGFRMPSYYTEKGKGQNDSKKTIPVFVFPTWYYCPICHHVEKIPMGSKNVPPICSYCKSKNPKSNVKMIPERFIVVCPDGHVDDLPVLQLLHGHDFDCEAWEDTRTQCHHDHVITRYASSKTSSVAGISYRCTCGASFSMADVIGPDKEKLVKAYGSHCPGTRPWLGKNKEGCSRRTEELKVIQRGGTNVWYPFTISSLFIPKSSDACVAFVQKHLQQLEKLFSTVESENTQKEMFEFAFHDSPFEFQRVKMAFQDLKKGDPIELSESQYRYQEYKCLLQNYGKDNEDLFVSQVALSDFPPILQTFFTRIAKVKRLKETRALVGFSRLNPDFKNIDVARRQLSEKPLDWAPAVQSTGEGIFFEFNQAKIDEWSKQKQVAEREAALDQNYQRCDFHNQYFDHVTSIFVLIHTFAHIFINELSKECGYGSSSLRERLYVSDDRETPMHGVLIYTSSGDSEGSLGGLVRQAEKGRLQYVLENAIREAGWCSSDPICINSQGQGPDSCNLAACFSCALLPETCCETGNRFLDRGMLVGNQTKHDNFGFFDGILRNEE